MSSNAAQSTLYPPHNEQRDCEAGHKAGHEAKECRDEFIDWCKSCGHGHHKQNNCPLVPKGKKRIDIDLEIANTFTPIFWKKYCEETRKAGRPVDTSPSSSQNPMASALETFQTRENGESSTQPDTTDLQDKKPLSKEEIEAEKRRQWDKAGRSLPHRVKETRKPGELEVNANFFEVTFSEKIPLYRYSINFEDKKSKIDGSQLEDPENTAEGEDPGARPDSEASVKPKVKRETKRFLIEKLLTTFRLRTDKWATDYDSIIISAAPLFENSEDQDYVVLDSDCGGELNAKWRLLITFRGQFNLTKLKTYVDKGENYNNLNNDLQSLNIISWKTINDSGFAGGRVGKKFYPEALVNRTSEAEKHKPLYLIRQGFFSSMRPGEKRLLLNVNTTMSAFYAPVNLQDWMAACWGGPHPSERGFLSKLKHIRVTFNLQDEPRQKWVIHSLSTKKVREQTFYDDKKRKNWRVGDYMKDKYRSYPGTKSNAGNASCINVGGKDRATWLPADHLTIVDWQILKEKVPESMADDMIKVACKRPRLARQTILNGALSHLGIGTSNNFYNDFGLRVAENMLQFPPAPRLGAPQLQYRTSPAIIIDGGWYLTDQTFQNSGINHSRIHVLWLTEPDYASKYALTQLNAELVALRSSQTTFEKFELPVTRAPDKKVDSRADYRVDCVTQFQKAYNPKELRVKPTMLLVILPKYDTTLYPEPGERVRPAEQTMIVGADVTHPGTAAEGCPSMAGVVATADDTSFTYLASARLQKSKQEHIEDLKGMMKERLRAWILKSKRPGNNGPANPSRKPTDYVPMRILFYRDGVSESQYGMVIHEELPKIEDACREVRKELRESKEYIFGPKTKWEFLITLIVVAKRHHARFYPVADHVTSGGKEDTNLKVGTIIDSAVMPSSHFSFYLQSHDSPLGTARSAHYVVLYDNSGITCSELERITNDICYTGSKATKALSVCTPARYADLLRNRLRCYMEPALEGIYKPGDKLKKAPGTSNSIQSSPTTKARGSPLAKTPGSPTTEDVNNTEATIDLDGVELENLEDEEKVPYYEKDHHVWQINAGPESKRKNPWHENMDKIMFYL
ncbi:Piwi domain-containing protein [Halenospora varia]|nr:Piwi domain-containing protein [Halenospora varia]